MSAPTYTDPWRVELARAAAIGLVAAGAFGLLLFGGELLAGRVTDTGVGALVALGGGVGLLLWSRRRSARLWAANRAYLIGEDAASIVAQRRAYERRALWLGRVLLALFLVAGTVFFFLLSAISCGDRVDGYCGDVGRPAEWIVVVAQIIALTLGCAWAATISWRRRHDDQTERIDRIIAEGQRRRRSDNPLAGTDRSSWE